MSREEPGTTTPGEEIRRLEEELARARTDALARERSLLLSLVVLHDGFVRLDRAILASEPSEEVRQALGRFALLRRKVEGLLEKEGVLRVNSLGEGVNPELHEVIETQECDVELSGKVVEVEEEGYLHKGEVLRMAKVVVGE